MKLLKVAESLLSSREEWLEETEACLVLQDPPITIPWKALKSDKWMTRHICKDPAFAKVVKKLITKLKNKRSH